MTGRRPRFPLALTAVLAGLAVLAPSATAQSEFSLNTFSTSAPAFGLQVQSPTALEAGRPYVIEVRGTWSAWGTREWTAGNRRLCGRSPNEVSEFLATRGGRAASPAGIDAERRFSLPRRSGLGCDVALRSWTALRFSTGDGRAFTHPAPLPSSNGNQHRWRYAVIGTGQPVTVRLADDVYTDNQGVLVFRVEDPYDFDCTGDGFGKLGFASVGLCLAAHGPRTTQAAEAAAAAVPPPGVVATGGVLGATGASCLSRRRFVIRLPKLKKAIKARVVGSKVFVLGKRVDVRRRVSDGRRIATVDLRGRLRGAFRATIYLKLSDGRTLKYTRRFLTCRTV